MTDGFVLVDKQPDWTSHDVVSRARGLLKIKKIGHAGTLDPMATGLLVLGVGRATRLLRFVQEAPKTYMARVVFGVATDTLDADGAVLERSPLPVSEADVRGVIGRFVGRIHQVPPMVSAVRVGGRRLYELAREGVEVERTPRPVEVHAIDILEFAPSEYPEAVLRIECGSGTYVRTLADDIAGALGGRAHLGALRRLTIGSLHVDAAVRLDGDDPDLASAILTPALGLADLPAVEVGEEVARAVRSGSTFTPLSLGEVGGGPHRILDSGGDLLAVYAVAGGVARPEVVLS